MAERTQPLVMSLGTVGFATDMPIQARQLTHYTVAQNVIYELSGEIRKVGGDSKINSVAIGAAPTITGMFDYWRAGAAGTFAQKFVAMTSNSKIYKDDMDGTFDDITGAATITASAIPVFCQARDTLMIFDDKNDTPLKWTQSGNVASLGGTPPVGRGAAFHVNRAWVWGVNANPSRLYYSSSTSIEDWSSADTGSFDIDPEDGDRIVGVISYKKNLFIFKGPNKGSIHVIGGSAPTGADAFNRTRLTGGLALQTHNSMLEVSDDVWFMTDKGVHSLSSTQSYGDFKGAYLSRFLDSYFRDTVSRANLHKVWAVNYADKGCVLWVLPINTSTTNNVTLGVSYSRITEDGLKWFTWNRSGASAAIRIHPTSYKKQVVFGGTDGFARLEDQSSRSLDSTTAYSFQLSTPWMMTGEVDAAGQVKPYNPADFTRMAMRSVSVGNYDVNVHFDTDRGQSGDLAFNQGANLTGGGAVFDSTVFDTATFGTDISSLGPQFGFNKMAGNGRAVRLDITEGGLGEDARLYELVIEKTPSAYSEVV